MLLESREKEIARLNELNSIVKSDKESLEGMLFETQTNLETLEMKRETMEKDIQDLLSRQVCVTKVNLPIDFIRSLCERILQDSMKETIERLERELDDSEKRTVIVKADMSQQLSSLEIEYKQKLENLKMQHDEQLKRLELEKVRNIII